MSVLCAGDPPVIYRTAALGTRADLIVTDPGTLEEGIAVLERELAQIDRVASRFRADSEVRQIERAAGAAVVVSPSLFEALSVALRVAEATDGAVDPTVGAAVCRLGYDRDFDEVTPAVPGRFPEARAVPGWRCIGADRGTGTVRVPPGVRLDLGATAKALVADRIATTIFHRSGTGVLVSLGGDVAVAGPPPPGGFRIGLADVCASWGASSAVAIGSGGLATSGITARHWRLGDRAVHHIVDPSTGHPVDAVWRTASVAAGSCVDANAASTAAMVKGRLALGWLESVGLPARLVAIDGEVTRLGGWPVDDQPETERLASSR